MASSISILAGILLKMNRSQEVTEDELQQLAAFASQAIASEISPSGPTTTIEPPTAKPPTAKPPTAKPVTKATKKIVKKIQEATATELALLDPVEIEDTKPQQLALLDPVEFEDTKPQELTPQHEFETSYKIQTINPSLCQARKVNDKEFIPGTESNKVYAEIQCTRKKTAGSDFCKFCGATEEKWRTGGQKEKKWSGRVTEPVPDHIHVVGSTWYKQKYPHGISRTSVISALHVEPSVTDVVLDDSSPIQVVEWEAFSFKGTPMIRHIVDGRVYKADMSKIGVERILFDQYQGRWEDDDLNIYSPETDNDETEE